MEESQFFANELQFYSEILDFLEGVYPRREEQQPGEDTQASPTEALILSPARLFEGRLAGLNGLSGRRKEALAGLWTG
jgi:hypothetical protein